MDSEFPAEITSEEFEKGEVRHREIEPSRAFAMAAGLTKSSAELKLAWERDPQGYLVVLRGALAAYDQNQSVEELLRSAIARLASIVDSEHDKELLETATAIALSDASDKTDSD